VDVTIPFYNPSHLVHQSDTPQTVHRRIEVKQETVRADSKTHSKSASTIWMYDVPKTRVRQVVKSFKSHQTTLKRRILHVTDRPLGDVDLTSHGEGRSSAEKVETRIEVTDGEVRVTNTARLAVKELLGLLEEVGRLLRGCVGETKLGDPDPLAAELAGSLLVVGLEGIEASLRRAIPVDVDVMEDGFGALGNELTEIVKTLALVRAAADRRTNNGQIRILGSDSIHVRLPLVAELSHAEVGLAAIVWLVVAEHHLSTVGDSLVNLGGPGGVPIWGAKGGNEVLSKAADVALGIRLPVVGPAKVVALERLAVGSTIPPVGETTLTTRVSRSAGRLASGGR